MVCVQSGGCKCLPSKQNIHGDTDTSKAICFVVREFGFAMLNHLLTSNLGKAGWGWSLLKLGTARACLRGVGWWGLCCCCGTAGGAGCALGLQPQPQQLGPTRSLLRGSHLDGMPTRDGTRVDPDGKTLHEEELVMQIRMCLRIWAVFRAVPCCTSPTASGHLGHCITGTCEQLLQGTSVCTIPVTLPLSNRAATNSHVNTLEMMNRNVFL